MLTVFLFKRNLIYICITKGQYSYSYIHKQLEYMHIQANSLSDLVVDVNHHR